MSSRSMFVGGILFAALIAVAGCSKAPESAMADADQAMAEARAADAATYAPEALQAATLAQEDLTREIEAQNGRFVLFRDYDQAEGLATQAATAAREAASAAVAGKTQARDAAQATMTRTRDMLTEATTLLAAAPRGKGSEADLEALGNDLRSVETILVEAQTEFEAENYREASARAEAGLQTATGVKQAVEQAQELASRSAAPGTRKAGH